MEKRKRDQSLSIRLTKAEKSAVRAKARRAGMKVTDYVCAACLQTELGPVQAVKPVLAELRKCREGLDRMHDKADSRAWGLRDIADCLEAIYREVLKLAGRD